MSVFNPALRLFMLLSNVYDTYKVLKVPLPYRGERPSNRALMQRKRDMKGCLAVWIVWTCFLLYERLVERVVCIFIPFYSELKMIVVIFLTLTKARSAEAIYLHILRPLIKPYVPFLDAILEVACGLGDFVLNLFLFPIHYALSYWRRFRADASLTSDDEHGASTVVPTHHPTTDELRTGPVPSTNLPPVNGRELLSPRCFSESEFASDSDRGHTVSRAGTRSPSQTGSVDEWRKYPPFPSAYPPTPLPPQNILISPPSIASLPLAPIAESTASIASSRLRLPPRAPLNPGFISSSSDEDSVEHADSNSPTGPHGPDLDEDSRDEAIEIESDTEGQDDDDDDDEEDEFNVTLQTPMAPYGSLKTRLAARSARDTIEISESDSCSPAGSTILTGLERPPSVRTTGSSDSASSLSVSDAQKPQRGRKRAQPKADRDFLRPKASDESSASSGKRRPSSKSSSTLVSSSLPHFPSKALDADQEEQSESESDTNPGSKGRRLHETVHGRPVTRSSTTTGAVKAKGLKATASASQLRPPRTTSRPTQKPEASSQSKSTPLRGGTQAKSVPLGRPTSVSR